MLAWLGCFGGSCCGVLFSFFFCAAFCSHFFFLSRFLSLFSSFFLSPLVFVCLLSLLAAALVVLPLLPFGLFPIFGLPFWASKLTTMAVVGFSIAVLFFLLLLWRTQKVRLGSTLSFPIILFLSSVRLPGECLVSDCSRFLMISFYMCNKGLLT